MEMAKYSWVCTLIDGSGNALRTEYSIELFGSQIAAHVPGEHAMLDLLAASVADVPEHLAKRVYLIACQHWLAPERNDNAARAAQVVLDGIDIKAGIDTTRAPYQTLKLAGHAQTVGNDIGSGAAAYRMWVDPRTKFAHPRLSRHPDPQIMQRINHLLEQRHRRKSLGYWNAWHPPTPPRIPARAGFSRLNRVQGYSLTGPAPPLSRSTATPGAARYPPTATTCPAIQRHRLGCAPPPAARSARRAADGAIPP